MPALPIAEDAAGFILAGGRSSRMGSDKALVQLRGRPLVEIAVETFRSIGFDPRIAGARSSLHGFAPVVEDLHPDQGPMSGIHAALTASTASWNLFLPVDMPLMPASLLRLLLERAILTGSPVTAIQLNGRMLPFPAVLHRSVLPHIEQCIASRQLACRSAWQAIPSAFSARLDSPSVETLRTLGLCSHPRGLAPHLWFHGANTPSDLAFIHGLL